MYSYSFKQFFEVGDQAPQWFSTRPRPSTQPWRWLQPDLNTGITNIFDFLEGSSNCTNPQAVLLIEPFPPASMQDDPFEYNPQINFWSCAFYPNFSRDVRESRLPAENQSFLLDRRVDTTLSSAVSVASFLSTCLVAYCDMTPSCKAQSCTMSQLNLNSSLLSAIAIDNFLDNICKNNSENLSDPDIAGVGVVISFYVQSGIAMLAALVSGFFIWLAKFPTPNSPNSPPILVTKRPWIQRVLDTITISLNDFQRAQCCFAIAINIASLITLHNHKGDVTQRDRFAMLCTSTAGITPTIMILVGLMVLNERHSALTFWLTCFTWVLSLTVGFHPEIR